MSETTSTNISVAQANSTDSIQVSSTRYSRMTDPSFTKRICFYKSGDPRFNGIKMVVSNRSFKTFDALLDSLSKKVPLPFGVRNITTPRGIHHITTLEELADGKSYICSHQRKIKPINLERASKKPLLWQSTRPISARRRVRQLTRHNEVAPFQKENTVVLGSSKNFVIFKNGDKECKHSLVLNKKYIQNFDVFLDQISDVMQFPVYKLYSTDGRRILSTHALLLSSGTIVAAGREPFKPGNYESEREFLPAKLPGISHRVFPKSRSKQEMKSPGKWKVSVFTSEMPLAGTTSQVYIIFYGHLRASAPVFLYSNEEDIFQSGHEDTFDISIGDIGEVYKIRIGHTNSGASPGWHCQEVQLLNIFSNEQFCIKVNRWLARDKEDGEICREIPLLRHNHSKLPVTNYKIEVETGDLWNAGTEANVYIVLQGQYGDTGSRHLHKSNKPTSFAKGQTDTFYLEAVHLGDLRTVIVGHDGLESGNGWYLEKVIVHDEVKDKEYKFLCHRWLDEGEDDGKIVGKLSVTDEADFPARYELEAKKKEMWAAEKWKYQNKNCLQLYCRATGKFIRLTPDGKVDALGDKKDKHALFDVLVKRGKVRVFRSHHLRHLALAIDKGVVAAMDNSGILCELQLHIQPNRCVTLESTRIPGMTISFNSDGEPARDDTRGYADIAKEFSVHVKGMFHSGAVILLATSWSQALCLRSDGSCSGAGKQKVESYWRVHKTGPAVCMFESVTYPRGFLQIKNGSCNGEGTGDEYCQFKVEKNYENGSVTLESIRSKGIYIGLLPNGFAKPMIHTGEKNIVFYPQVIKFGREKPMGTSATLSQKTEELLLQDEVIEETLHPVAQSPSASPPSSKSARRQSSHEIPPYTSNDWKVSVLTGTSGTSANVTLWVYGSKGSTGPISLGKGNKDHLFQPRQEDQFKVEIPSIGKIYKIRIGQDGSGDHHEWELKQIILQKMKNGKTLSFEANKWLSKNHGNGDLMCELPVVEDGVIIYPVVKYKINIYTGHLEEAGTEVPVYICLYGERGDSGRRILSRPDSLRPFQQGQVDVFEIEAVSLGKLQSVLLGCEANHKSQYWYCEKVIIREQGELSEYIFNCERWLPYMSQGYLHSEIELLKQETELSSEVAHATKANEGDWKITLVTGNFPSAGTDATVFLHVYGTEANSGPIMLGSGSHQLFNVNSADTFQINLKSLHKPYKIRIGHDNSGDDPEWYLEEVKLHNLSSNQELNLPVNRWLGENHDDGDTWRELLLGTDASAALELLDYEIQVYTGDISDADAESAVYINIFGTRGDSGKRKLHKSKFQTVKFQKGQVDIFCIQAVSLGTLAKIHITCDGSKNGNGWFLDKVTIQYEEDGNNHNVLFPCSRWFDEKQDDGRTERELFALERENPEEDIEGKLWNIQITTANDSLLSDEMKVNVIIYGSHGKTNDIFLLQNSDRRYFFPGSKDEFLVKIKDIGEIYKIRIVCDHVPSAPGWHLTSIDMVEQETRQEMQFDSDCWLFVDAEEAEVIKEFPVLSNQQELIPVNQYIVSVHIGDHWGAETFANVYITLYGERGDSGARQLYKSSIPGDKFTRNKIDTFELEAVSLGQLRKVILGHDREGYGAGMHLKMVTIKESQDSLTEWVFPFWNWLDSHLALYQTVCKLYTAGKRLSTSPIPITQLGGVWIINITGSGFENAENLNSFSLSFYGNEGKVQVETTISGDELQVKDELQVGTIFKVQISWSHIQVFKSWYLSSVHMKHTVTNQEMWLSFQCWMMPNEDRCIEIPALYPHKDPLPVVEYTISIHTGDQMAGRSTGRMYICIEGEHGDTGNRVLNVSDVDIISFTKGQVDLFTIKAVYLGQLQKMTLGFNNLESDSWFLGKIVVKEDYTCSRHTFHYNDWITSLSEQEFTESVIMMTETTVELSKLNPFNTPTNGKWQLRVLGTPTLEEDMDLSVVVFGKNGKSSQQSVTNLNWDPFLLSVGNIGNIIKASFLSTGMSSERRLHLQKIRMRDVDTKQEIGFYPDKVYLPGEDCSENVAEVAAVLPNQPPLDEATYSVYIRTGDFPASSTAADVFITIYGENGDSCKRRLINTLTPKVFGKGKINFFKVKAVDLGMLSRVHIEHDAVGYGAGWYLDQITIQKSDKADIKYLFPCRRWLDTAINDKQTDCELKLLGKFSRTNEKLLTSTEGIINIIVMTDDIPNTGTNSTVYLTICCDQGSYEPVAFDKGALKKGKSIQTVEFNGSLGSIQKVRLEMEDDEKDNSWFCKMVQLQHVQSGDILEFPFLQTFGSKENNLAAELPVLKPSGPFLTVKTYYISISIHQAPKPNTDTDLFITLSGTMGNTGRRRVTCKRKALSSKTVGFQLKTVDVGVIHKLLIEKGKQTNLQLEKAVVEEGSFIKNKYIFVAQPWKKEKTNMISMTLQVTEIKNGSSSGALLNENHSMTSDGEWKIYLFSSSEEIQISEILQNNLQWSIVFYGDKGRSNPLRLEEQNLDQWKWQDRLTYKVNLSHDLGELFKVRLGTVNWHEDLGRLSLHHLNMQNTRTLDTFNQSINKTLPLSLSGDKWIEVPVEWPLRASLSAVTYSVIVFVSDTSEQKKKLSIGVCLHGKHGDTGHRYINWQHVINGEEDESFTAILDAVELGEVHQADISMSSSDDCKLHIKRIHVKESSRNELYVFNVNESFSIQREKPETRIEVVISQVVRDQQGETDNGLLLTSNPTGTVEENLVQHKIIVYTGDVRGAGTDANVYIILFYGNGFSIGPVWLKEPQEESKPFQNGKVDTFIIATKTIGRFSHIEIGHDGKGLGNGWFLEKVEIVTEFTNEKALFSCNRWLAEDEDDGRTVIQLYC
ncbi:oxygen-regulated protein 1 [Bufo bufo]|uniref:oxygen-regulated protein 1 n=1 Tax=Bufo bufo TaxID=8384 RepID=UPI001ABDB81A|nr:oxygen-regulated protein 1 [Bufo bufo]